MGWKELPETPACEIEGFVSQFRKKARFLVDESLGKKVAEVLTDLGWNARYVGDEGLAGRSDEDVFARAWADNRIILTHDGDFLDDRRFPPNRNPGVVVLPGAQGPDAPLITALAGLVQIVAPFREGYWQTKVAVSADATWTFIRRNPDSGAMEKTVIRVPPHGRVTMWEDE